MVFVGFLEVLFQVQISLNQTKILKPLLLLQQYFLSILNIEFARSYNIQSNQTGSLLGDFGNISLLGSIPLPCTIGYP